MDIKLTRIYPKNLKFTINDIEYTWYGGFGAIFHSYENGIKKEDIRAIGGVLFKAYRVDKRCWGQKAQVSWATVNEDVTMEDIRSIREQIFCGNQC